jgi:hypothetical protein
MILRTSLRRGFAFGLLAILPGCYVQRPLAAPVPAPSTRVVAGVTDQGMVEMGTTIGAGAVEVEGVVAAASADAWRLYLLRVDHRDGRSVPWNRELIEFPRLALTGPREKRLDRNRTLLFSAGVVAGAYLLSRAFNLFGGSLEEDNTPIPEHIVVPGGGR